ncbi:MAG: PLP-dependent aminotransferase family protein [Alphaproteobacteria bacterium]|nr:PLP-dependent aminotransferase family protein [Alphaproteobacteria bacterium]
MFNPDEQIFADRMMDLPRSFVREILEVATQPNMISFAGGLPNKNLFPVEALRLATEKIFEEKDPNIFQYASSEGFMPLRRQIADRYAKKGMKDVKAENILITSGSQQAFDLVVKAFINEGDKIILEEPTYLGAIQAFSLFNPTYVTVPLQEDGPDTAAMEQALSQGAKLLYLIPNFQNPSGTTTSAAKRKAIADLVRKTNTVILEDDPYGELSFSDTPFSPVRSYLPEQTILLGSFSKVAVPAFRIGWMVLPDYVKAKILVAKEAADLHTNTFTQRIIHNFLTDNDLDAHIARITARYKSQKEAMIKAIAEHFPKEVSTTNPLGGMFLWASMPKEVPALKLFEAGVQDGVCIVPGNPFYAKKYHTDEITTMRLCYASMDEPTIEEGIKRLGKAMQRMIAHAR